MQNPNQHGGNHHHHQYGTTSTSNSDSIMQWRGSATTATTHHPTSTRLHHHQHHHEADDTIKRDKPKKEKVFQPKLLLNPNHMKPLLKTEILSVEVKPPSRPPPQSQLTVEPETLVEHFNTTIDDKDEEDDVEEDEVEDDEEEMEDDETSSLEGEEEMYDDFDVVLDHHNSHSVDEFLTEEEKEKRRQALALEQQQLILAHVQAGRAMREKQQLQHHQKQPAAAAKMVMELDIDDEAREQRHSHQTTRLPRTKGVAFRRFGNGSLRRVDRHGEPSLRLFKTPRRQEEKETGDEAKKDAAVIDKGMNNSVAIAPMETVQKEFIPAPIPKVSAWKLGTCAVFLFVVT